MKAGILAVGTELTLGQIINRNASDISARLLNWGIETTHHITLPDDRALILEALEQLSSRVDVIFVTGGLGPTSDDFTRDQIAEWAQKKLIFQEPVWEYVQKTLLQRGQVIRDMQKQQCYFPEDSELLENAKGTALGFYLQVRGIGVFALPGPPTEIAWIWDHQIAPNRNRWFKTEDPWFLLKYNCLGAGESEIAHLTEQALSSVNNSSSLLVGYRVHAPFVEVKLQYQKSKETVAQAADSKLRESLKKYFFAEDSDFYKQRLLDLLQRPMRITIEEHGIGDSLIQRLLPGLANCQSLSWLKNQTPSGGAQDLSLFFRKMDRGCAQVGWKRKNQLRKTEIVALNQNKNLILRAEQELVERAIAFWSAMSDAGI